MYTFLSIIYVMVCLFLIFVVLLQPGRGGMGSAFGGGGSQTVFGASGAGNFLTKLTTVSAALFMILSVTLAYMSSSSDAALKRADEAAKAKRAAAAAKAKVDGENKTGDSAAPTSSEGAAPSPIKLEGVDGLPLPEGLKLEEVPAPEGAAPVDPAPAPVEAAPAAPADAPAVAPEAAKPAPVKPGIKPLPAKPAARRPAPRAGAAAPAEGAAPEATQPVEPPAAQ